MRHLAPSSTFIRARPLEGGVSAAVTAVEVVGAGGEPHTWVVRRHGPVDLHANPQIAADEFNLLRQLWEAGLPVPEPLYLDDACAFFPTPVLVVAYVEGATDAGLPPVSELVRQMAEVLAAIHGAPIPASTLSFLPRRNERQAAFLSRPPQRLDASIDEGRIRAALASAWPPPHPNPPTLLHGDYWPGNMLWRGGRIVGVIDWEDAAWGEPLADLAGSRLEVLWAYGPQAMDDFTRHYTAASGADVRDLPYWDLCAALRPAFQLAGWADDPDQERTMRERLGRFSARALAQLTGAI